MIKTVLFLGSIAFSCMARTPENHSFGTLVHCHEQTCRWMGQDRQLVDGKEILNQMMQAFQVKEKHIKRNLQYHIQYIQGIYIYIYIFKTLEQSTNKL